MKRTWPLNERPKDMQVIEQTVRKVVHTPTIRAKEAMARGDENLLQAARWLFGLEEVEAELTAASPNGGA